MINGYKHGAYGIVQANGTKLAANSVSNAVFRNATIGYAKIAVAAIEQLSANAITAVRAHINELVAGSVTTDKLYADLAKIGTAQITTANIKKANIDWASIAALTAEVAKIAEAEIEKAEIGEVEIDWAEIETAEISWADIKSLNAAITTVALAQINKAEIAAAQITNLQAEVVKAVKLSAKSGSFEFASIRDLVANALILEEGVGGSVYIKNLAATNASFVGATMGELVLKGVGGNYYNVIVQADGTIATEQVYPTAGEIADGEMSTGKSIVETSVNVKNLNAANIKGNEAISYREPSKAELEELVKLDGNVLTVQAYASSYAGLNWAPYSYVVDGTTKYFHKYAFHACRSTRITLATLGNDAGAYGAFKLALDEFGA